MSLELVPIAVATQREELSTLDAAIVRLPIADDDDLHVIPLYEEVPVVVASTDSHLLAADELEIEDLAGEVLLSTADDVLGDLDLPTRFPRFLRSPRPRRRLRRSPPAPASLSCRCRSPASTTARMWAFARCAAGHSRRSDSPGSEIAAPPMSRCS